MDLRSFRQQNPEYDDMSDRELADALYNRFYSDIPRDEFDRQIGLDTAPPRTGPAAQAGRAIYGALEGPNRFLGQMAQGEGLTGAVGTIGGEMTGLARRFFQPPEAQPDPARAAGPSQSVRQGLLAGFGDEVTGGLAGVSRGLLYGGSGNIQDATRQQREAMDLARQERPVSTFALEAGGAIAPFALTGGATSAPGIVGQAARAISPQAARTAGGAVARTAGIGGVTGAITGAGEADLGNRALGAVVGGGLGAVAGPALGALAGGAGRVANMGQRAVQQALGRGADAIPAPQVRPSQELREASRAAYEAVDAVNARYRPQATRDLVDNINDAMREFELNQELHPRAYVRWQLIRQRSGLDLSLRELDQQRQLIRRDVASSRDPAEAEAGRRMIEEIDNFIATAGPERMSEGGGREAAQAIEAARQAHRRYRKVELLEDALERTANREQSGNPDQLLRGEVRRLLESPRTRNAFTPEEREALQRFVRGAPSEQVLRGLSRFSPLRGFLPAMLSVGAPFLAQPLTVVPAVGLAADATYNAMRRSARRGLMEQIALTQDELALLQAQRAGRAAPARAIGAAGAAVGGMGAGRVAPE